MVTSLVNRRYVLLFAGLVLVLLILLGRNSSIQTLSDMQENIAQDSLDSRLQYSDHQQNGGTKADDNDMRLNETHIPDSQSNLSYESDMYLTEHDTDDVNASSDITDHVSNYPDDVRSLNDVTVSLNDVYNNPDIAAVRNANSDIDPRDDFDIYAQDSDLTDAGQHESVRGNTQFGKYPLNGEFELNKDDLLDGDDRFDHIGNDAADNLVNGSHYDFAYGKYEGGDDVTDQMPRVFCWVLSEPEFVNHTMAARETWTRGCDGAMAVSPMDGGPMDGGPMDGGPMDGGPMNLGVDAPKRPMHISDRSKMGWMAVHSAHVQDADYFLKAEPQTYVFVRTLKQFLAGRDPETPEYFGRQFENKFKNRTFMHGGSGYVLSRAALNLLVDKAFKLKPICIPDGPGEDSKIGDCLSQVGVRTVDTRDENGRETFLPFHPSNLLTGAVPEWYKVFDAHGGITGPDCCSETPITFNLIDPRDMYMLNFVTGNYTRPKKEQLSFLSESDY